MSEKKIVVAMDVSSTGKGGGPYTSSKRIMSSKLRERYRFEEIIYRTELGRGISIRRILDLIKQIRSVNPDIIHITGLQLSGFHVALASVIARVPIRIITIHGMSIDALNFKGPKRWLVCFILEPLTLLLTSGYTTVSDYVAARRLPKVFARKYLGTVYNFPPKKKVLNISDRERLRARIGISDDVEVVIMTVARITEDKGYAVLTKALKLIDLKGVCILVVGEGEYLETMKRNLSSEIANGALKFLGYRNDVSELHNISDIFVLPTLHETLSIAVLEAVVHESSVVASNVGGIPEIIKKDVSGFLVTPNDHEALAAKLKMLIHSESLREEFSSEAYKNLSSDFSEDSITSKWSIIYNALARGRS